MKRWGALVKLGFMVVGCACSLSCGSSPSEPGGAATISIGPAGLAPAETRIRAWNHVTFVNNDIRPHVIVSDPIDVHDACPPINRVGLLNPGERRDTGTLTQTGACGFHDHSNQTDPALKGRIVVQ